MDYKSALEKDVCLLVRLLQKEAVFEQFLLDNCFDASEPSSTSVEEDGKIQINGGKEMVLHLPSVENPSEGSKVPISPTITVDTSSSKNKSRDSTEDSVNIATNYHKYFSKPNDQIVSIATIFYTNLFHRYSKLHEFRARRGNGKS